MPAPLLEDVARRLGTSPEDARRALRAFSGDLRREAHHTGAAHVPTLGTLRATERGLTFAPADALEEAANRRFAGLGVLSATPPPAPPDDADAREADAPPEAASVYETPASEPAASEPAAPEPDSSTEPSSTETPPGGEAATRADSGDVLPAPWAPDAVLSAVAFQNDNVVESEFVGAKLLPMDAPPGVRPPASERSGAGARAARTAERRRTTKRSPAARDRHAAWPWMAGLLAVGLLAALGVWFALSASDGVEDAPPPENASVAEAAPPAAEGAATAEDETPNAEASGAEAAASPSSDPPPAEAEPLAPLGIERVAGTWTIVVSSKTSRAEAQPVLRDYRQRLSDLPFAMDLIESATDAGTRYRVAVGPFPSFEAARAALQEHVAHLPEGAWLLEIEDSRE